MEHPKPQKHPWISIEQPLVDPRYQLIDSERYIDSLERRLNRIQGRNKPEPSSKDMISSLATFHEDQMRLYMDADKSQPTVSVFPGLDSADSFTGITYIQRRFHPERQAISSDELFELLKDDHLEKYRAELLEGGGDPVAKIHTKKNSFESTHRMPVSVSREKVIDLAQGANESSSNSFTQTDSAQFDAAWTAASSETYSNKYVWPSRSPNDAVDIEDIQHERESLQIH